MKEMYNLYIYIYISYKAMKKFTSPPLKSSTCENVFNHLYHVPKPVFVMICTKKQ